MTQSIGLPWNDLGKYDISDSFINKELYLLMKLNVGLSLPKCAFNKNR